MNVHKNARLTPLRREEMVRRIQDGSLTRFEAAHGYGVSLRTVDKWLKRYRDEGQSGMADRTSRPRVSPKRTTHGVERAIFMLRRRRQCGTHIAKQLGVSPATVSRVFRRAGLPSQRLCTIDP